MTFKDHFSTVAAHYASFRPTYPESLFDWISSICPRHGLAWDCATGSGQAAVPLARRFNRVVATDASKAQLCSATKRAAVDYVVSSAEDPALADGAVHVICVAQALHWFDLDRFFSGAARVLSPGSPLCVWSYGPVTVTNASVDRLVQKYYSDILGSYWPAERAIVDSGYAAIELPGQRIDAPSLELRVRWGRDELLGYMRTWSATRAYMTAKGTDPIADLQSEMPDTKAFDVVWPLTVKASRPSPV